MWRLGPPTPTFEQRCASDDLQRARKEQADAALVADYQRRLLQHAEEEAKRNREYKLNVQQQATITTFDVKVGQILRTQLPAYEQLAVTFEILDDDLKQMIARCEKNGKLLLELAHKDPRMFLTRDSLTDFMQYYWQPIVDVVEKAISVRKRVV